MFTSRDYAIGMAHFQISGGWKIMVAILAAYALIAGVIIGLIAYNTGWPLPADAARGLFLFTLIIESLLLVSIGTLRVGNCIRLDVASGLIESHRLMPIPAWRAVAGYLFGTTHQIFAITLINIAVLVLCAGPAGVTAAELVTGQVVLAFFSLFCWSFAAMGSMMIRQMLPLLVLAFIFGTIGSMALRTYGILPGLSVLTSPLLGSTIFPMPVRGFMGATPQAFYGMALFAQVAFSALFFVGTCRRYRGTFLTTLNIGQALVLGLVWNLLSIFAIWNWDLFRFNDQQPGPPEQITATLIVSAGFLIVPVHALAEWRRRNPMRAGTILAVLVAAALIAASPSLSVRFAPWNCAITFLVMAAHALTLYALFRALRLFSATTVAIGTFAWLVLIWIGPLIAEVIRWNIFPAENGENTLGLLSMFSPVGLLGCIWNQPQPHSPLPGLLFQWLLPVPLALAGKELQRRNRSLPPPPPSAPATPLPAATEAAAATPS
jgi:hypothetical protein